jgi:hypothetical protein
MEDLRAVMQIIDKNSPSLPEGDYLELCNRMKNLYKVKGGYRTLFNYDNPIINPNAVVHGDAVVYFEDYYYDAALVLDKHYLGMQMEYLLSEKDMYKPLKRMTKSVKRDAIIHYCNLHNILLDEYTEENLKVYHNEYGFILGDENVSFDQSIKQMYKSYVFIENEFRYNTRRLIEKRIERIEALIDELENM